MTIAKSHHIGIGGGILDLMGFQFCGLHLRDRQIADGRIRSTYQD